MKSLTNQIIVTSLRYKRNNIKKHKMYITSLRNGI